MTQSFIDPATLDKTALEHGADFAPRFDGNGLIMAVTTDAASGTVLMVAYMNAEALELTLSTGLVHYYSRSRQSLWKKGESSGEMQQLVEIRTDCDQDVLLVRVNQTGRGAACHTGKRSCFYRSVEIRDGSPVLVTNDEPQIFDPEEVY
ncbi:phosphoribosyl-AMP cyclohydrolase [Cucumibacter marinus]|uniref:phosphoribosyl-AMP cyclohydrolase n=1 Tax=Cucumibacter marinus TaxID=1121252 RepID=UPI0004113366|nr:phosphoribosyl-AMP cyclohydrolase [Cucumibacter marinus]